MDLYDEEFQQQLKIAKGLIGNLGRKTDKDICLKWITKLLNINSNDPLVKKNRNHFLKYMLTILHKQATAIQQLHDEKWNREQGYMSKWSPDKKTYVAAKPLPGRGALVYMAVAKDPSLGWDMPGTS